MLQKSFVMTQQYTWNPEAAHETQLIISDFLGQPTLSVAVVVEGVVPGYVVGGGLHPGRLHPLHPDLSQGLTGVVGILTIGPTPRYLRQLRSQTAQCR